MSPEKTKYLLESFPKLYASHMLPMSESLMCFGFEHSDGWYDIIHTLSSELETLNNNGATITAEQVKEKYGTLRFYISYNDETTKEQVNQANIFIGEAEFRSAKTCEGCGKPGKIQGTGWIYTACDECFKPKRV
jgi:hypothetical protein